MENGDLFVRLNKTYGMVVVVFSTTSFFVNINYVLYIYMLHDKLRKCDNIFYNH